MESSDSDSLFDSDYNMESESSTEDYVIWEKNVDHIIESDLGVETGNIRNGFSEGEFDSSGEEDVNQDDNNFDESKISDSDEDVVDPDAIGTGDRNDVQSDGHNSIPFMPDRPAGQRPPILPPTPLVHSQDDMGCLDFHLSHTGSNIQMGVNLPYRPGPSPFQQLQMSNNVSTIMGPPPAVGQSLSQTSTYIPTSSQSYEAMKSIVTGGPNFLSLSQQSQSSSVGKKGVRNE
ncbi:hypothetical protein DH2020_007419 [Rehmannia glutinosa]|uniref:Uncharacterized protein n=1 Tax=Rehmannia glutinosa TaxID=99300 RepID=A0ABR0TZ33_REHGL